MIKEFRSIEHVEIFVEHYLSMEWSLDWHGVCSAGAAGYTFKWDTAKKRFGRCTFSTVESKRVISLSKQLCEANLDNPKEIIDVILHEIGHGLSYLVHGRKGYGHNSLWRDITKRIGGTGTTYYDSGRVKPTDSPYTLVCPCCASKYPMFRKPKRDKSCGKCSRRYNPEYKLTLIKNK